MKKEILYPVFLQTTQYTTDPFWIYLFENLAYGICPYGIIFSNDNSLCCRFKGKEFTFYFIDKTDEEIFVELQCILQTKCNINSKIDHFAQLEQISSLLEEYKDQDWNQLRKKNVKECLLENYVIDLKNTYNLTNNSMKKLYSHIILALQFKLLNQHDIIYDINIGKITHINGICMLNNKLVLKPSNSLDIESVHEDVEINSLNLLDCWDKYCYNILK